MRIEKLQVEKTVYLVRHGQSVGNITPIFQASEGPLSKSGELQAENMAKRVSKLSFEALIASPFKRATGTAKAIEKITGKKIELSDLFTEAVKPTSISGKPYTDERAKKTWVEWAESLNAPGIRIEDGENFDDIIERADKALSFLQDRPEKSIVVITHGFFLRALVARVLLGDLLTEPTFKKVRQEMEVENTGITALQYVGMPNNKSFWRLWIWNDHAHLAE